MNAIAVILIYLAMLVFDAAVLAGTVYLIITDGWSTWWMLAAVLICAGSNPKYIIATALGTEARESC